jgi:hypothetical protein
MLAEFYEDGAVSFEGCEGSFCASQVAGFEDVIVVFFFVAFEGSSITVRNYWLALIYKAIVGMHTRLYL